MFGKWKGFLNTYDMDSKKKELDYQAKSSVTSSAILPDLPMFSLVAHVLTDLVYS